VHEADLVPLLGLPKFAEERVYDVLPFGVSTSLARNEMGGSLVYIESIENPFASGFTVTGKLGDVMKESSSIAYTVTKNFLEKRFPDGSKFKELPVHMHLPEGATPKDGPSAGIGMVTSLLSLALTKRVPSTVALMGELTLTGRVLEVDGVKEKTLSAKRAGIKEIILPKDNLKDWDDLDKEITQGIKPTFVEYYDEVYKALGW
jgi:Lon-like ATP-dependent protease